MPAKKIHGITLKELSSQIAALSDEEEALVEEVISVETMIDIKKNEIIRRMGTSQTQFYRLIKTSNYNKTIDQMLKLLSALDITVEIQYRKVI